VLPQNPLAGFEAGEGARQERERRDGRKGRCYGKEEVVEGRG